MKNKPSRREFIHVAGYAATGFVASTSPLPVTAAEPQARRAAAPSMSARFRELIGGTEPLVCPAAHDSLTARLVELEGFKGIFIGTSAAASINFGLPDTGSISFTEILSFVSRIASSVDIPTLADADDLGTTPLNVYRNARDLEKAGIGAVMFDDRTSLARAGGQNDVIPKDRMVDNIRAATDGTSGLVLIVRCYSTNRADNLDRCIAYGQAGADILYPGAGLRTSEEFSRAADLIRKPLMTTLGANMQVSRMKESKIAVANGGSLVNIALGAVEKALVEMKNTGAMTESQKGALSRDLALRLTRSQEVDEAAKKYNVVR